MIVPTYAPGDWFAVVTDGTVALLDPGTPPPVVDAVWRSVRAGEDTTAQLQALLGEGLAAMPPFAIVTVDGGTVRAIVRGAPSVTVGDAGGERRTTGVGVATWVEALVPDARRLVVRGPGAESAPGELPVLSGVVRASRVEVDLAGDRPVARRRAGGASVPEPVPDPTPAAEPVPDPTPAPPTEHPPAPEPVPDPTPAPEPVPGPAPAPATEHPPAAAPVPAPAPGPAAGPPPPPEAPVAPAAPAVPAVPTGPAAPGGLELPLVLGERRTSPPAPGANDPVDDDHDGLTVLTSDIVALRGQLPHLPGDAVPGPLAVPTGATPPPARIALSTGQVVSLERPVLLGRAPQVSRVSNAQLPRLVAVPSPTSDISRTHAQVRQEGDDVLVTDLHSTNGVLVTRAGGAAQRLHPGEPSAVSPGDVVDLGDGVTFVVEAGS